MIYQLIDMEDVERKKISISCFNSHLKYNHSLEKEDIELIKALDPSYTKAIKWWCYNVKHALNKKALGIKVHMRSDYYSKNSYEIPYRKVKALVNYLESHDYIHIYKGGILSWEEVSDGFDPNSTVLTCLVFRERLYDMFEYSELPINEELPSAIEIKNRVTKELKSTRGYIDIKEMREKMNEYNESLIGANITYLDQTAVDVKYIRKFVDNLEKGGRLYEMGGYGLQVIPQQQRATDLLIDGESIVELDFKSMHANICYHYVAYERGENVYNMYGSNFDPYSFDMSFVSVNKDMKEAFEAKWGVSHNPTRALAKLALLIAINCKDKEQAVHALSNKIRKDRMKKEEKDMLFYAIDKPISVTHLFHCMEEHNHLIRDRFFSDIGVWLQSIDSKIFMALVGYMLQAGHVVLCYHDSAVCRASAENDLMLAMRQAWIDVLGNDTFCKIEKK